MQPKKLSLMSAIFINVNIMLGTGLFINTVLLTYTAGALGAAVYVVVGLLILPLILVFSHLLQQHPGGTFYEFGRTLTPLCGFVSSWSYFVGKLATSALGIHIFVTLMQQLSPLLAGYNPLMLDTILIGLFVCLNMFNLTTGKNINYLFIILKFIPIIFVICTALVFFDTNHFTPESLLWRGIPCCAPFVLFAFAGFEASCSLSKSIENPKKNGPKAILISYLITLTTVVLYQLGFFSVLGTQLGTLSGFQESLPTFITHVFPTSLSSQLLFKVLTLTGVAASSLGASYGVIYSNIWNLYTLAERKHTFANHLITRKNRYNTPFVCVLIAGIIVFLYLFFTNGYQVPLQQISAFAVTITYTISVASFCKTCFVTKKANRLLALLSITSCMLLLYSTLINAQQFGVTALLIYGTIIITGMIMFYATQPRNCPIA